MIYFIYKLYKEVQGGDDSEIQPKDVLLKQQETLTTLSKVHENYQLILENYQNLTQDGISDVEQERVKKVERKSGEKPVVSFFGS